MGKELILLELEEATVCSLAIMVKTSQAHILIALDELREMLNDKALRPEHLQEDEDIQSHISLHELLLQDSELIMGEIEQGISELAADNAAKVATPFWDIIKP